MNFEAWLRDYKNMSLKAYNNKPAEVRDAIMQEYDDYYEYYLEGQNALAILREIGVPFDSNGDPLGIG